MLDSMTILDILEKHSPTIQADLGPRWAEFSHRVAGLAGQFRAIADEKDPQVADCNLGTATYDLFMVCMDYPYITRLLDQADKAASAAGSIIAGEKRPPLPGPGPKSSPQEIANRYYSLLTQLKPTEPVAEDDNESQSQKSDRRTHA